MSIYITHLHTRFHNLKNNILIYTGVEQSHASLQKNGTLITGTGLNQTVDSSGK